MDINTIKALLVGTRDDSNCQKKKTSCLILKSGKVVTSHSNHCEPPNGKCQRLKTTTGKEYGLCNSTHAEQNCAKYMKENNLYGGVAFLYGHYYACEECVESLKSVGVTEIILMGDTTPHTSICCTVTTTSKDSVINENKI